MFQILNERRNRRLHKFEFGNCTISIIMKYDPEIHHRRSIRLRDYDYSQEGYYFVTVCTKNRECYFGKIIHGEMELSKIGLIAHKYWNEIPKHFDNVILDEMVIMPDHLHGIVVVNNNNNNLRCRGVACNAPTGISPKPKSLPTIIRSFKSAVSNLSHKNQIPHFQWQRNYYEHIIRNENELNRIRQYIRNNPLKHLYKNDR